MRWLPAGSSWRTMGEPLLPESYSVEQERFFKLFQLTQAPSSQRTQNESWSGLGAMISAHMRMVAGAASSKSMRKRPCAGAVLALSVPAGAPTPPVEKNFMGEVAEPTGTCARQ